MLFGRKRKQEPRNRQLANLIASRPTGTIRPPWRLTTVFAVGGLEAVGFAEDEDTLLVASSNGQGVFDCVSGERIYRNPDDSGYDWKRLSAQRLDQPDAAPVRMSGLHGGGLRMVTDDGWHLETIHTDGPLAHLLLVPPGSSVWDTPGTRMKQDFDVIAHKYEFRVSGFSWSGKTLVWSDEVDIRIYSRG